jgi:hypothetical protein
MIPTHSTESQTVAGYECEPDRPGADAAIKSTALRVIAKIRRLYKSPEVRPTWGGSAGKVNGFFGGLPSLDERKAGQNRAVDFTLPNFNSPGWGL